MQWKLPKAAFAVALIAARLWGQIPAQASPPPEIWTWDQVKEHFELQNTTLLASRLNIAELKAQEITAHLRPNPDFNLSARTERRSLPAVASGSPSPEPSSRPV